MKKLLSLTLALCMALTLVACGSKEEAKAPTASVPAKTETKTETKTEAPSEPEAFELDGPVTFIVPYATGGSADTAGRLVAQYLGEVVGQQINVVNKEGASGVVGSVELSQAKKDGYTIGVASVSDLYVADYRGTFDINSVDFINWYLSVPLALYSSPNSPWNDFSELIADIKAGNTNIAMAESGAAHLIGLGAMCKAAGIDMIKTVSFGSGGESQTALLGNHVDLASLTPSYYANVTAGGGKLMGIYGTEKLSLFPDLTYTLDYGLEVPAVVGTNQMIMLPKDCPAEIVEFWENAMQELLADADFQEAMSTAGYPLCNISGAELDAAVASSCQAVNEIATELGLE